ncbi:unnamed protein product [Brassica napus]|nr:unnamed protein product [Brassica napus]
MGNSLPLTLTLPELKYPIGSEPKEKNVSINQHSTSMYISIVESILTADEIERVRGFLGPRRVEPAQKTRVDASDERVCLAMLLLVESIMLPKNNKGTFPLEYVNKAKDIMYPWGRDAYLMLLSSIQKAVANHVEDTSKFELQGYPLVFHLWILESIPLLRDKFSNWAPTVDVPGPIYLCEKYIELKNPSLERVLQIETHKKVIFYSDLLKVTCILPPIPHDPEDDVSMEEEHSDELKSVKDISKKGYKFKADDWKNRSVDTLDTLGALIHMTIHMTENVETSQASASIEDDSENTKLNKIIELMMENAKSMKDRMSLLEAENMELRARVSELEGNQNVAPHTQTPVFPTNVTQQTEREPFNETSSLQTQEFSPNLLREVGTEATNETPVSPIAPQSIETPVFTPIQTQQMVTEGTYESTEPLTEIISATNTQVGTEATNETPISPIAPQSIETPFFTPIQTQQMVTEGTYDSTEPLTEIISATNKEPLTEIISAINKQDTHAVHNTPSSPVSSLISRVIEETQHLQTSASSPLSTLFENGADVEIATSDDATCRIWYPGNVFATNLCDGVEKVVVTLFADQKRVTVTADKIRPKPPADDREKKFEMMDNVEAFYSKGWSSGQHVDAAFAMLNQKRIEQSSWFSEQGIPKACFVPVQFFETVGYSYENLQKPDKKGINILKGWVGEVVRGLIRPNKMWMQDVDIVYGVVHERLVDHFIGVEIHLMENTITIFQCGVHKVKENPLIQKLAVLIPAIKLEMMNEEINFNDIVPFQVKKAEGLRKTKLSFNCGLFVVKMLECRSLGLKKRSSINDDTAMDLRRKLCCEMYDLFMDKDFQEGCRR